MIEAMSRNKPGELDQYKFANLVDHNPIRGQAQGRADFKDSVRFEENTAEWWGIADPLSAIQPLQQQCDDEGIVGAAVRKRDCQCYLRNTQRTCRP
jgi:hypothetical protein